jgi:methionyl aminopeptidase
MITIKTPEEIERLKEGGKHLAAILHELTKLVAPGVSTMAFEDKARDMLSDFRDDASFMGYTPYGAPRPYPASVCVSINDEIVHGIPNENPRNLVEGDIVTLDMGVVHDGLFVDGAVTIAVGKVSEEVKKLMQATKESLQAGIDAARAGNTVGHIGAAVEAVAEQYGFALAEDLCGHGVGYGVHEEPFVPNFGKPGEGPKLKPGMVLAIEPMLTLGKGAIKLDSDGYTYRTQDGSLAAHYEHTVIITDGDPIVVTK